MSTKWNAQDLGKKGTPNFSDLLKDEYTVILLRGKNAFGDMIYCYLKITHANVEKLEKALAEIVRRHESLRTSFTIVDGEPVLEIAPTLAPSIDRFDLSALPESERKAAARRLATEERRAGSGLRRYGRNATRSVAHGSAGRCRGRRSHAPR